MPDTNAKVVRPPNTSSVTIPAWAMICWPLAADMRSACHRIGRKIRVSSRMYPPSPRYCVAIDFEWAIIWATYPPPTKATMSMIQAALPPPVNTL